MKKTLLSLLAMGAIFTASAQNPFAYGLSTDRNVISPSVGVITVNVNYSLNADAESVNALIKNAEGKVVKTIPLIGITKGTYENVELDLAGIGHGNFTWAIEVKGGATSGSTTSFCDFRFYHPRGVDVDNNMESPAFGNVYVTEGMTSTSETYHSNTTTSGGLGLYAFTADMEPVVNSATGKYGFDGGWKLSYKVLGTSNAADLARVRVAEDGRIFVTRMTDKGDFIMYAPSFEDLAANNKFTSLLGEYTFDASTLKYSDTDGNFIAASNLGFDVKGSGEDLKLLALSSNASQWSYVYSGGSTDEYALGTAEVLPVPTNVAALTGKYTIAPSTTNVDYDNRGGIWYCQYRGTPTDAQPALVYIDENGEIKYFEGTGGNVRGGGGVRVSPNGTQIAIATSKTQFTIYNLEYAEDNTPTLTNVETITHGIGTNVYDIAWDLANNIYICGNSGEYLKCFAVPRANNVFATQAASKYALYIDETTAIGEINVDTNAPVEYYNLQGVKVENPSNGIFIKKQGAKATKVVL